MRLEDLEQWLVVSEALNNLTESVLASSMPIDKSEQPNDTNRPSALTSNTVIGLLATSRRFAKVHLILGDSFSTAFSSLASFSSVSLSPESPSTASNFAM